MQSIEKSIEVNVPLRTAYNQWTQFEEFPLFMEGVKSVTQHGDKRLHWHVDVGGKQKDWEAEIFEQIPDQRIAWRTIGGSKTSGMVNFSAISPTCTQIQLKLNYEPEGAMESVGGALGVLSARVAGDLKRFKEFIERRQTATGGWRGEIHGREVISDPKGAVL